jgi:hypothetical protein
MIAMVKHTAHNIELNINILYQHLIAISLIIENAHTFKHIFRILNIKGTPNVPYAIEAIKGAGRRFGYLICKILCIKPRVKAGISSFM